MPMGLCRRRTVSRRNLLSIKQHRDLQALCRKNAVFNLHVTQEASSKDLLLPNTSVFYSPALLLQGPISHTLSVFSNFLTRTSLKLVFVYFKKILVRLRVFGSHCIVVGNVSRTRAKRPHSSSATFCYAPTSSLARGQPP